MVDSAGMKDKEAKKRTDVATLKALLIESNASQKRSQRDHEERRENQENGRET